MTLILNTAAGASANVPETTHWEWVAESTTWGRYISDVERQVILRAESVAGDPGNAVDLGCGGGRWSKELAARGWNMTCLDVNRSALGVCQRNVPSAKCILTHPDDQRISLPSASAQLALCVEVVPLIESSWFLPEMYRVLSKRGILVGVYINGKSLRGLAWRLKQRFFSGESGLRFYNSSYSDWKEGLHENGFELLHEESCCWGPFTRNSNSRLVPACARMERALGLHRVVSWSPWVVFIARKMSAAPS